MLTQFFERRLIVVLGKGGVGKSTISGALAICAADHGLLTLLMETDSRAPISASLGMESSLDPVAVGPRLSTMVLDGGHALDEYLGLVLPGGPILKAVFASRIYQFFVQTAPGLRELMMLGKIYYEVAQKQLQSGRWDLVILDAPASGQALSLLRMPTAARATFASSIVGQEAENIGNMLRDQTICALLEVTTPETLAVSELLETHKSLAELDLHPEAIALNRVVTTGYDSGDIAWFARRAQAARMGRVERFTEIATRDLERASQAVKAQREIAKSTRTPVVDIPEYAGLGGKNLLTHLASFFASRLNMPHARHGAAKDDRTRSPGRHS